MSLKTNGHQERLARCGVLAGTVASTTTRATPRMSRWWACRNTGARIRFINNNSETRWRSTKKKIFWLPKRKRSAVQGHFLTNAGRGWCEHGGWLHEPADLEKIHAPISFQDWLIHPRQASQGDERLRHGLRSIQNQSRLLEIDWGKITFGVCFKNPG